MDSLPLRFAPAGNDTERLTSVIPGEPKAREGDRVQDEAPSSLPLVGRARVGVFAPHLHRLSLTPPPPPPPHRKSGVPDLRKQEPISGKPEMGGEESPSRSLRRQSLVLVGSWPRVTLAAMS